MFYVLTSQTLEIILDEESEVEPRGASIDTKNKLSLTGYPNPVFDSYTVESNVTLMDDLVIRVLGATGSDVMNMKMPHGITSANLNLSHINSGVYFVLIEDAEGKIVFRSKIIKMD